VVASCLIVAIKLLFRGIIGPPAGYEVLGPSSVSTKRLPTIELPPIILGIIRVVGPAAATP
jgi:hypothetical protein